MSSKKLTELEAGALNAWTPVQQAALYQTYLARQAEKDDEDRLKELKEEERKKETTRPEKVEAGKVIDGLIKERCPALFIFLNMFGPPHIAIVPFVLLHFAFWFVAPWYLHHLIPYPMLYLVPIIVTLKSIYSRKDRAMWQAWWVELALVEYFELLFFRGHARSLIWWPKMKAVLFVCLYCVIHKGDGKYTRPIFGAIKVIKPWLPELPKEDKREKEDGKEKDKNKSKSSSDTEKSSRGSSNQDKKQVKDQLGQRQRGRGAKDTRPKREAVGTAEDRHTSASTSRDAVL